MAPHLAECGVYGRIFAPLHNNAYLGAVPGNLVFGRRIPEFRGRRRLCLAVNGILSRAAMSSFDPQIVHETYFGLHREAPRNARTVLTVYDMIHEIFTNQLGDPETRAVKATAIARADLILCISEHTRQDLIRFFPEVEQRTRLTYLAFDASFGAGAVPRREPRPYLLHVGPRWAYKNFAALLDAYALSSRLRADFDLVCVGGGPFGDDERAVIQSHGLAGRVRQYAADDIDLQAWYAGASIFVYPSVYEGFGIPPLEAMASGVPVVAVDASSVTEVCAGAAELAPDGSSEALRAAIEAVAFDSDRAARLKQAGLERINRFSWAKAAQDTAACYRELV